MLTWRTRARDKPCIIPLFPSPRNLVTGGEIRGKAALSQDPCALSPAPWLFQESSPCPKAQLNPPDNSRAPLLPLLSRAGATPIGSSPTTFCPACTEHPLLLPPASAKAALPGMFVQGGMSLSSLSKDPHSLHASSLSITRGQPLT